MSSKKKQAFNPVHHQVPFVTIDPGSNDAKVGLGLEEND